MEFSPIKARQAKLVLLFVILNISLAGLSPVSYGDTVEGGVGSAEVEPSQSFFTNPAKFLKIYLGNRKAFTAFSKEKRSTPKEQAILLYHHLCQDHKIKAECKKYKKKLVSFFEAQLTLVERSTPENINSDNAPGYLQELDEAVMRLRQAYQQTIKLIDQEISLALFDSQNQGLQPSSAEEYNQMIQQIFERDPVLTQLEKYRQDYWTAARAFPGEILLSNTLQGRIEGNFYNVIFSDVILSVNELAEDTRHEFEETLIRRSESIDLIEGEPLESDKILSLASTLLEDELKKDWDRSNHLHPHSVDDQSFALIRSFHSNDIEVVRLLARNQIQRAIWRLLDISQFEKASQLEDFLSKTVLNEENIVKITSLGGGFTTTQLVRFKDGAAGVYKPKPWSKRDGSIGLLQNIKDTIVSHYKKEIAAYRISSTKMLGLNLVPFTEKRSIEGSVGSLQYFVNHATQGRFMHEVELSNPKKAGKWTSPSGRTALPKDVMLFDWLIGNRDRNIDNYLLSDDGRVVLIDHSWSFLNPFFFKPGPGHMAAMFPSERIFENINRLNQNPQLIDNQLVGLISQHQLKIFKKKVKFISESINHRIESEGREKVFPIQE